MTSINNVLTYIQDNQERFLNELNTFLSFKSVSTDIAYKKDVDACADYVKHHLETIGLESAQIFDTPGHPIIYAEHCHQPNKPTVLFYGHYDVQPADPIELWDSDPFKGVVKDGKLYARGVSDDKGQVFCHLKSIESWLKTTGELPINIKVLIEGEEEIGSPNLPQFLQEHTTLLQSDIALVSDTPMYAENQPSICFSLRGLVYLEVMINTGNSDLHSGQQGGAVPNPIHVLCDIISGLKDKDQKITIPGFYDDVLNVPDSIRQDIANLNFDDRAYKEELGAPGLIGEKGFSSLERRWFRPTLDCNGILGGYTGEGSKTVIPHQAMAKISMRLVANQDPTKIMASVKSYITSLCPDYAQLSFKEYAQAFPAQSDSNNPGIQAGLLAIEKAFGTKAILQGEGGTIPVVADLKKLLNIDTVLMGFNLPNDRIHAPNERFSLKSFYKGIEASAYFFDQLGLQN